MSARIVSELSQTSLVYLGPGELLSRDMSLTFFDVSTVYGGRRLLSLLGSGWLAASAYCLRETPAVVIAFLTVERRTAEPHASNYMAAGYSVLQLQQLQDKELLNWKMQSTWAWVQSQYHLTLVSAGWRR